MKKFTLSVLIMMIVVSVSAQGFMHSVGYGYYFGMGKMVTEDDYGILTTYTPTLSFNSGVYYPRYNLLDSRDNNLSIGSPIALGFSFYASTSSGTSTSFGLDLPAMIDFNFGHASTERSKAGFGGFVGAGFGYTFSYYSYSAYYGNVSDKCSSLGPVFHAGVRFPLSIKRNDLSYTLRFMYKKGLDEYKFNIYSLGVLVNLGI